MAETVVTGGTRKLVFFHIAKSAGTSIVRVLQRNYGPGELLALYTENGNYAPSNSREWAELFASMDPEQWERIRCIAGHTAHLAIPVIGEPFRAFAVVRDPVDRVMSLYHYLIGRGQKDDIGAAAAAMVRENGWSVADIYERFGNRRLRKDRSAAEFFMDFFNGQSRALLAPHMNVDYELPIVDGLPPNYKYVMSTLDRVLSDHYVLGAAAQFDETIKHFAQEFNWADATIVRENVTANRPSLDDVPEEEVEVIRAHNLIDEELYRRAQEELARSCGEEDAHEETGPVARFTSPAARSVPLPQQAGEALDYIGPAELLRGIVDDPTPLAPEVISEQVAFDARVTEYKFVSEVYRGEPVRMHAWLARPLGETEALAPVLLVPGGRGITPTAPEPAWMAARTRGLILAVDWIGAGRSDAIAGLNPYTNAMRFEGDYRSSWQYHNVRALVRATSFLLSQPDADPDRLMAIGGSWGGFYSWLLAGIDERFRHIFPTFGCGYLDTELRQVWESYFISMGPEKTEEWLRAFDPGRRAHLIKAKVHYVQATNDRFYSLVAAMKTFHTVPTEKRLMLVHNQDHMTAPYNAQDVTMLSATIAGTEADLLPDVRSVRWIDGTNLVEVDAEGDESLRVLVVYSGGRYTQSFARYWRTAQAELRDGRWVAEVPVVDPDRELWLYGHAIMGEGGSPRAASTTVLSVIPSERGLTEATATFDPVFDLGARPYLEQPVGDRHIPAMELVEDDGVTALSLRFGGDPARRAVAYCLEGDLIAAHGYDAIRLRVKVPRSEDVAGLKVCLITDFNALAEQAYVVELDAMDVDFGQWQWLELPFSAFDAIPHRRYDYYQPPLRPLDVSRLCAVGLFHDDMTYRGEAMFADISVRRSSDPPAEEAAAVADEPAPPEPPTALEAVTAEAEGGFADPAFALAPAAPTAEPAEASARSNGDGSADGASVPAEAEHPRRVVTDADYDLHITTTMAPEELRRRLKRWEPWRHDIFFSNGVRTTEFATAPPFVPHVLSKWHLFEEHIPESALRDGHALDVGSNIGQYSLYLRSRYGMTVTGLELSERNLEVAHFLLETTHTDRVRFLATDANRYRADERYDLILHLGTLDHFKDPFLALENAAAMMAPGGHMALELQTYVDPCGDENICLFTPQRADTDHTSWWLLGKHALLAMLDTAGFVDVKVVLEWASAEKIGPTMRRLCLVARAPGP